MKPSRPPPNHLPAQVARKAARTLALAVRLYGNVMSGGLVAAILLLVAPSKITAERSSV